MVFEHYLGELLKLFNFVDDICIISKDGIIEYAETHMPELYSFDVKETVGKHILDIYKSTSREGSLYEVLKTGVPILDNEGCWTTFKGDLLHGISTTLPIYDDKEIIGAIEITRFLVPDSERRSVFLRRSGRPGSFHKKYFTLEDMVTQDPRMLEIKDRIAKIASGDMSVLICGDTGTGKEVAAQAIHSLSPYAGGPFISQNCAAIPPALLESMFFGTERGAYTGAENRKGLFELADHGTLFLDEINSMEVGMQAKILKSIEEKKIRRVGGQKLIDVSVRVISALNEDPLALVAKKQLRRDLFYRLSAVHIVLPPLRERSSDIEYLADYFIRHYNSTMNRSIQGLSDDVLELFHHYEWPGNVRELKNVIEAAFTLAPDGFISAQHLPDYLKSVSQQPGAADPANEADVSGETAERDFNLKRLMEQYEYKIIMEACGCSASLTEAAQKLGMSKQSLNYRRQKYKNKFGADS